MKSSSRAVAACRFWMRKLRKNTKPSGAKIRTHFNGLPNSVCPNGVNPVITPAPVVTTAI